MYQLPEKGCIRLKHILQLIDVSKSTWWKGVKDGRFPQPVRFGSRLTMWHVEDIKRLIEQGNCKWN
ncbi:helix-turn-helix transcriptional regulator [Legionella quinlivanii]|uniref:helix-turn-helix transcriptional regulator n=1 Tax=Legionella quinlivanii TaxID=45073 RepID=UPI0022448596|nr:AlpA family phage regulatory protein [Legionella quinlivanii]MCW8450615.1 AlpA family phage regulatory protein [Legionella quinlivanii]